jgi:hypothetical protein
MSWAVYKLDEEVHVAPILDQRDHDLTRHCACNPKREVVPDTCYPLWVHNSFDGREFAERAHEVAKGARN